MNGVSKLSSSRPWRGHENIDFQGAQRNNQVANLPLCCFSSNPMGAQTVENTRHRVAPGNLPGPSNNGGFGYSVPANSVSGGAW